ncbi:MAG: MFS transporter [Reyranellaceae bacterium]
MNRPPRPLARLREAALLYLVTALSLLLLVYVGYGEASRTYPRFLAQKMVAQGALVQTSVEAYLRAGLPLRQFPGFRQIADPIISSDPSLASIAAWDAAGLAFAAGDASAGQLPAHGTETLRASEAVFQIGIPLRNRFESVGEITVSMNRAQALDPIERQIPWLALLALALALLPAIAGYRFPARTGGGLSLVGMLYTACFAVIGVAVVALLVSLYNDGAQAKAKAMADSLAQRLRPIVAYHLQIGDFDGIDAAFHDYRRLNPDLQAVALLLDDRAVIHSDAAAVGRAWQRDAATFEYRAGIGADGSNREIRVAVALPTAIVWSAVARSVKNFAALFLASALMAYLFLQLVRSSGGARAASEGALLAVVRPVFFVAVFAESLAAGFLPQAIAAAAAAGGLAAGATSLAFTAYFVAFLLVLLPTSHFCDRRGPRGPIVLGAAIAAGAWIVTALDPSYTAFAANRLLAGAGQGMLFIGVQHFIVANAPQGERTRAAAIIVFGFNGGMIAGASLGSLLVNYIAAAGVFTLAASAAGLLALYAWLLLPRSRPSGAPAATGPGAGLGATLLAMAGGIPKALASGGFLRAILLVGLPSKAVLTGIVGFALPLVLARLAFPQEDIGQILMLYGCGVLLASAPASRHVDRTGRSGPILVAGSLAAGVALAVLGCVGAAFLPEMLRTPLATAIVFAGGTLLLGLAHGCINAPIITHVSHTSAAHALGAGGAAALYRVLERLGHVAGPLIAAQMFLLAGGVGANVLLWAAAAVLALAGLFAVFSGRGRSG